METHIIVPDIQAPQQDDTAISVALKLIKYISPTRLSFIGDVICADAVSKYPKSTWREAKLTLDEEVDVTNRILDKFDRVIPDKCKVDFLEGNHERRIDLWCIKNTTPLGKINEKISLESLLMLKDRGYNFVRLEEQPLHVGRYLLIHGHYVNKYHTAKTIGMIMRNVFYGHAHDYQVFTSYHSGDDSPRIAMSCGCLCKYSQHYMQGRSNNWMHGIAVIYSDKDSFTPYYIQIVKGRAIWNGKVFKG